MFVLSIVFVASSVVMVANPDGVSEETRLLAFQVGFFLWGLFVVDFVVRLLLSENRWRFAKTRSFEFFSLLLPYLRPFLLIPYIWRLQFFRKRGAAGLRMRAIASVALFAFCFVYTISTLVYFFEAPNPKANIRDWGDAIWWGFTTISTVGYGDFTPITTMGRILAIMLMVGGIFVVGVSSAMVISAFNDELKHYLHSHAGKLEKENEKKATEQKGHKHGILDAITVGGTDDALVVPPRTGSTGTSPAVAAGKKMLHSN